MVPTLHGYESSMLGMHCMHCALTKEHISIISPLAGGAAAAGGSWRPTGGLLVSVFRTSSGRMVISVDCVEIVLYDKPTSKPKSEHF